MEAIALDHVTLAYGDVRALDDVSLTVARGERVCVLGANGSGKSTLASVVAGLLAPDAGDVRLAGHVVFGGEEGADFEAYAAARREIGLVFQNPDDQIVTTVVDEDVAFGPENLRVAPDEIGRRVGRELRRVAMDAYAKANPTTLSGGQKQRVAIAGALAMEPQVLVLDEPGSLLDVRGRRGIMRVMDELRSTGITVIHVTHFMDEALAADRAIVLDTGRVVAEGAPREVFARFEREGAHGLDLPFVARMAGELRDLGITVPFTCDEDELAATLAEQGRSTWRASPRQDAPATSNGGDDGTGPRPYANAAPAFLSARSQAPAAPTASPVVEIEGATFSYADAGGQGYRALSDVTLSIEGGGHVAVVGHTGSGKSTVLRLLCALETPDEGRVRVLGVDTANRRGRRRLQGRVGYVMQHPERQLFAESVFDDVAFGPRNLGCPANEVGRRVNEALRLVGLEGHERVSPFHLSGGQQRLCAIAGILAMEPRLLVLDEPTAGLDPCGRKALRRLLDDVHAHGTTIVEVTHSMDDAALADQVVVLSGGSVLLAGAPADVFRPENAPLLHASGLGLPRPLAFARRLEADGLPPLGDPLTSERCAEAICARLAERYALGSSDGHALLDQGHTPEANDPHAAQTRRETTSEGRPTQAADRGGA